LIKADVHGSLEAVTESLRKLEREEVKAAFVHRGVGSITENDITLAAATNATIIGFNVRPDRKVRDLAEAEHVEIRTYEVIYKLIDDIDKAMKGLLAPEFEEVVTGEAEVRELFRAPKVGAVAGCFVRSGVVTRGSKVSLFGRVPSIRCVDSKTTSKKCAKASSAVSRSPTSKT
jgi:translation initiation factor IF-2